MCLVSVVIPYFNREDTIIRAINSVLNQTLQDFELILINDGSTDTSSKQIDDYLKDKNIKFKNIYQSNSGAAIARNNGVLNSCGKYIAFLDSDDSWERNKLEIQIKFMEDNPSVFITGTDYYICSNDIVKEKYRLNKIKAVQFKKSLFKLQLCMPTVIVRREILNNDLLFEAGKECAEDSLFYSRILRQYSGIRLPHRLTTIYKYEYGKSGLSGNINKITRNELENIDILYRENKGNLIKVSPIIYLIAKFIVIIKHMKRLVIIRIRS